MATKRALRRNVGRIDHVAFFYSSEDGLRDTREKLSTILGLDPQDWGKPVDLGAPLNIRTQLCWPAGLELICPAPGHDDDWYGAPLVAARGEGLGMVVFGVADIDEAARRATAIGLPPLQMLDDSRHPGGPDTVRAGVPFTMGPELEAPFRLIREGLLTPFNGTGLLLGQLEPLDQAE
jgi:hypothetical protein